MKVDFYHVDAFELPNYEPIWRQLKQMGVDARIVGVPGNKNTASHDWFDFERFKSYCTTKGIPFATEADPSAELAVTTQNAIILNQYQNQKIRLMYGLTAYPANWGFQQHAVQPFDAVLTHGKIYQDLFSRWLPVSQLPIIGYPRYDDFFSGKLNRDAIRQRWGVNSTKPVLVFLPTWDVNTGFDVFFPALLRLKDQYQIILRPHHCTLRFEPQRMALLHASGLLMIDNACDLAEVYAGADIVLLDVRSGSLLESCACGVPTVGMVIDKKEESGWLAQQGIDKVITLCSNPAELEKCLAIELNNKNKHNLNREQWITNCLQYRDGCSAKHAANALLELADKRQSSLHPVADFSLEKFTVDLLNQLEDQKDHPEVWKKITHFTDHKSWKKYLVSLMNVNQDPLVLLLLKTVEAICSAYAEDFHIAKKKLVDLLNQYPRLGVIMGALAYLNQMENKNQNQHQQIAGVVLGSGKGMRYGSAIPKQYIKINGNPCIKYAIDAFIKSKIFNKILVVIDDLSYEYLFKEYGDKIELIVGGETRNKSVNQALKRLAAINPDYVLFHDAARPMISVSDIYKFVDNIDAESAGLIAVRNIEDSLYEINGTRLNRDNYRLVQTPELFNFKILQKYFSEESKYTAIYEQLPAEYKIKTIYLNHLNYKITSPYDIYMLEHLLKYSPYKATVPYLQGKTALVLGGTGGIGLAVVNKLRQAGARVICPTRQELDLANFSYMFKTDFDIVINAAGAYHNDAEGVLEHYDEIMNVNLKSNLHIIDYVKKLVNRPIRIVCVSSSSSSKGRENLAVYSASKVALHSIVESMSRKLAEEGIYINVICPEKVRTPLLDKLHGKHFEENELLEPDEVAEAILSYADTQEHGNIIHLKKGFKLATGEGRKNSAPLVESEEAHI